MDKRTLDYIISIIQDEERSAVKHVLREVIIEIKERNTVRTKLLYEQTATELYAHMKGQRFENVYKLRNYIFHRIRENFEIVSILFNKLESIH